MMKLNEILAKLGVGSRETVYLSVTPGVGLELIQLDAQTKTVKNYNVKPLNYNESLKEIVDYNEFKDSLVSLFEESGINIKSGIVLNMPVVHFGTKELLGKLPDEDINEILISEVEQVYIFRKDDPLVKWMDVPGAKTEGMRKVLYTAIQKKAVDKIETILADLGASLIGVEISLTSIIRALAFSGMAAEQMRENVKWNLMVVNQSGYYLCPMVNQMIADYYEEPLPIKSFESEEVYNVLNSSAQITLMNYPASYLYIISETNLVSAELLAKKIPFDGTKLFIENNEHKKQDVVPVNLDILPDRAVKVSLEAIGTGASFIVQLPAKFTFIATSAAEYASENDDTPIPLRIGEMTFEVSPNAARKVATIVAVAIIAISSAVTWIFPVVLNQQQAKLDDTVAKTTEMLAQYNVSAGKGSSRFNSNRETEKISANNRTKLISYSALGETVPKGLWLTYFVVKDDGKIDIKGQTSNVEDVYVFYKNLKDSLINSKLRLHKLELFSDSADDVAALTSNSTVIYMFEITNMTEEELKPPSKEGEKPAEAQQAQQTQQTLPQDPSPPNSVPNLEPVE
ncbi:MAG: PilN domain-containing protein [Heliobacteriaceae bacterium]|jgi:hypothetical protein|nr:PilN domain-containing protein [Heliobacteriaceae bacterium]